MEEQNYVYAEPANDPNKAVMSLGDWIITLLVQMIPCVGLIMYFVWAFGDGNENRKNFCRASLIFTAISLVLCILLIIIFGASILSVMDSGYYY